MRQVNPNIYTNEYYLHYCSTVNSSGEVDDRFKKLFEFIKDYDNKKILDLGCGNGDLSIYLGKKGANVVGIDYSKNAIRIAQKKLSKEKKLIGKVKFLNMDANKIKFNKNIFDMVISIDVFEHLYPEELEKVMKKISNILKRNGELLVHTEANKIYLNFTHRWLMYPISSFLIWINKILTGNSYPNLPMDPRSDLHKMQHVNEPTYYYLLKLFKKYKFKGRIIPVIPYKPFISWKDLIYNFFVWLFPFSKFWPIHLLFAYDYICIMKKMN